MTDTAVPLSYDPYDFEIDTDPYPVWRRLRDEAPLYRNERFDFFALSRYEDVERASVDWSTYQSGRGSVLELIKSGQPPPVGWILFEDPPIHDLHRKLLSRAFTPRRVAALEQHARAFCAEALDAKREAGGFDFVTDLGAVMPMRVIGMLLGIPEQDQEAIRDVFDESFHLEDGAPREGAMATQVGWADQFAEYVDWRAEHPSDDIMTELLHVELTDEHGVVRKLTRDELLGYVSLVAAAGNETTTRLIGWTGKLLAEHPDQRRELVADRALVPNAIEELLRYEAPSPVQARYVSRDVTWHGQEVPEGSTMLLLTASANRDERQFADPDRFDIHRRIGQHLTFGFGLHFCLGASLARLEGRVALDEVLNRFPEWEVDWSGAKQAHTSTVRGWERLPVVVP